MPLLQHVAITHNSDDAQDAIDDKTARDMIGMGTWRLRGAMDPPFEGLTGEIEGLWRHMLPGDFKLYPLDKVCLVP